MSERDDPASYAIPAKMTIGVYRVGPDGAHTTIKETAEVEPDAPLESPMNYPPCQCGRPSCKTP